MTTENATLDFEKVYQPDLSGWVHWEQGGFDLKIKYLSIVDSEKLVKSCQKFEWDLKTHQKVEALNEEMFKKKIADLVLDWKGLTKEVAKKFVSIAPGTPDGEFPCTHTQKLFVIAQFSGFLSFVLDASKNLHQEAQKEVEEEIKN